jgi:Mrp family chromosome partitioning ATPase
MLDQAREIYDWVVIDTPPVVSVTDPVMCARVVDMVLLVVQYGGPKRQIVNDATRLLARTGVRISGVLLNKIDFERDSYYYSSYYSYYHYGEEQPKKAKKSRRAKAG